jgi:ATP-dependent exoDNAse (exonuclease V) beta subunit
MSSDLAARLRALDPATSFLVQAPAGSGKTSLLTQRYLRLLALVEEPEEILAITFTRKAAAEMRGRILKELRDADAQIPVEWEYERQTRALAEAALRRDAERDWQILAAPSRLRVQTIDSFEASLVARLPWFSRLGFTPDCTDNPKPLYLEAVRGALRQMAGSPWRASLVRLLNLYDNHLDRMVEDLAGLLQKREEWVLALGPNALEEIGPATLRQMLETNIRRLIAPEIARLADLAPPQLGPEIGALAQIAARNLLIEKEHDEGLGVVEGWPDGQPEALDAWRAVAWFLLTKDGELRKPGGVNKNLGFPSNDKVAKGAMGSLLEQMESEQEFLDLLQKVRVLPEPAYSEGQWQVLESLLRFLNAVLPQLLLQFGLERKTDFKEVSLRTANALEEAPGIPTLLAERMDSALRHILVDEFQDTSVLQVLLLRKLTASWVPGDGRTLFAVGDPMQSIYEWRNARVDLFLRAWSGTLPGLPPLEPLQLTRNFRSRRSLIEEFNGEFPRHFPARNDPASGAVCYVAAEADAAETDTEPARVECHAFLGDGPEAEAAWIAGEIARLQAADPQREGPRKIGVLFRARKGAEAVGEALRARGIRYQAVDVDPLAALPVVQDLRSMLSLLLTPEDRLAFFSVLRAPWNGLRLRELELVHRHVNGGSVWEALRTLEQAMDGPLEDEVRQRLRRTIALFEEAHRWRGRRPLHQLLRRLWASSGAEAYHGDARSRLASAQFLQLLSGFEDAELLRGLESFEEALANLHAPPDPEAPDTLQLLTIHKAKGLEFDVVFLPRLNNGNAVDSLPPLAWEEVPLPEDEAGEDIALAIAPRSAVGEGTSAILQFLAARKRKRERNERTRVLYVAFTRAKEKLHLLGTIAPKDADSADQIKPARDSYLAALWHRFADAFRQAFEERAGQPAVQPAERTSPPLRRMLPESLPELPVVETLPAMAASAGAEFFRPRGDFETAETASGTVFHRLMERAGSMAPDSIRADAVARLRALVIQELRALLPGEPAAEALAERVLEAFHRTLHSATAQPLFSPTNRELRCEQSIGYLEQGTWRVARMDRLFRDASGHLHVADFKLVDAELADDHPEAKAAFAAAQRTHHRAQLEHYARLLQSQDAAPEPITLMLYYPLQDVLDRWTVEPLARPA